MDLNHLHTRMRLQARWAVVALEGGVLLEGSPLELPVPFQYKSKRVGLEFERAATVHEQNADRQFSLRKHPQGLPEHPHGLLRPGVDLRFKCLRVHENGCRVLTFSVMEFGLVDGLPNGLVGVLVDFFSRRVNSRVNPFCKRPGGLEGLHTFLKPSFRDIAVTTGSSQLQHQGARFPVDALGSVKNPFWEVTDGAWAHHAVSGKVGNAFELNANLIEVVPVARRLKVGKGVGELEKEVVRTAFWPIEQGLGFEEPNSCMLTL